MTKSHDVHRWLNAEAYTGPAPGHHGHHHHDVDRHGDRIRSVCLTFDDPIPPLAFERWLGILTMFKGADILRVKGIVNVEGVDRPMVIHGVQHIFHPPVRLDVWPSEDRRSRVVFITRDLDEADLRGTLTLMTLGLEHFGLVGQDGMTLGAKGGPIPDRG